METRTSFLNYISNSRNWQDAYPVTLVSVDNFEGNS